MKPITLHPSARPDALIIFGESIVNDSNKVNLVAQYLKNFPSVESPATKIAFASVFTPEKGTIKKAQYESEESELLDYCETNGIKIIGCGVAAYFKHMTGSANFENLAGRVVQGVGKWDGYQIIPMINYISVRVRPVLFKAFQKCNQAFDTILSGGEVAGESKFELKTKIFVTSAEQAKAELKKVFGADKLFIDIETTGLRFETDRLLTIALGGSKDGGMCIAVHPQYHSVEEYQNIIKVLKSFFENYKGTFALHNAAFDMAFVVHEIMRGRRWDVDHNTIISKFKIYDTMLAAYVLMNTTADKSIGLKTLAFAEYGEYDAEIEQDKLIHYSFEEVATYNILDISATASIFETLDKRLDDENMRSVFDEWVEFAIVVLKMKMNGLRIDIETTKKAIEEIDELLEKDLEELSTNGYVAKTEKILGRIAVDKYNASHKSQKENGDLPVKFNPNSSDHKRILLFEVIGLETDKVTKSGAISTDKEVLQELKDNAEEDVADLIQILLDLSAATKVKTTYLQTFLERAVEVKSGEFRIFGNYMLTGTVSGRMSSNNPNLLNIPANSKYGKLVKKCFIPSDGFLYAGIDYAALI
jgi:DNA polymerase I